jgi:hypothetical protein
VQGKTLYNQLPIITSQPHKLPSIIRVMTTDTVLPIGLVFEHIIHPACTFLKE